jgi:hypothetical protein
VEKGVYGFPKLTGVGTAFCNEMTVVHFLGRDDGTVVGVGSLTKCCAIS